MNFRNPLHFCTVALVLVGGTSLLAQVNTGSLNGHVTDSAGQPLVGARLTFESPAIFGPRTVVTDAKGEYRAMLLPVGNYTIKVLAGGYYSRQAVNIRIGLGSNLTLDFPLKAIVEKSVTVEVVATVPSVSKTDDKVQSNFSAQDLLQLPISRSWDGALSMTTGVDPSNAQNIRGASSGGWGQQISYNINGIEVKSDLGGSQSWDLPTPTTLFAPLADSIEDIQIVKSALNARYGKTSGGMVNVSTKSGSNTFEGTIRANLYRNSWASNLPGGFSASDRTNASTFEQSRQEQLSHVIDITIGGPIVKDRLWFFIATELTPQNTSRSAIGSDGKAIYRSYPDMKNGQALTSTWQDYLKPDGKTPYQPSDIWRYPEWTYGNYSDIDKQLLGVTPYPNGMSSLDLNQTDWRKVISTSTDTRHYETKFTFQATPTNIVSLTGLYQREIHAGQTGERKGSGSTDLMMFIGDQVTNTKAWSLTWDSMLTSSTTLETKLSKTERRYDDVQGPTDNPVFVQASFSGGQSVDATGQPIILGVSTSAGNKANMPNSFATLRSSSSVTPAVVGNRSVYANLRTYQDLLGRHEIDLGGEYFQTEHQYGRERAAGYGVFVGGWIHDYTKDWSDKSSFLFPTMYTKFNDPKTGKLNTVYNLDPSNGNGMYGDLYLYNSWGPGAYIETYAAGVGTSWDNSRGLWANDTWTLSPQWNVMVGLRHNKFELKDTTGAVLENTTILEPRLQVKFNPDGKDRHIFSFTAAKLASKYSDDMASTFLTQGWNDRTVRYWGGLPGQAALDDTPAAAADVAPAGQYGKNGLRWVSYDQLINKDNYATLPMTVVAQSQLRKIQDLKVPWCGEFTLNYTRNFDKGSFAISLIDRTYHSDWIVNLSGGVVDGVYDPRYPGTSNFNKYMTQVVDPTGKSDYKRWQVNQDYFNSGLNRDYQSVEVSLNRQLTSHLRFTADYTYTVQHGTSPDEYYYCRDNKLAYAAANNLPESVWAPEGIIARTQIVHATLTYVHQIKNGNVSASLFGDYRTGGVQSLVGWDWQSLNIPDAATAKDHKGRVSSYDGVVVDYYQNPGLNRFYGGRNAFTSGSDWYDINARLQAEIALMGPVKLTTYITINNLFNRILRGDVKSWSGHTGTGAIVTTPLYEDNGAHQAWGYAGDRSAAGFSDGRSYGEFSIGLKF